MNEQIKEAFKAVCFKPPKTVGELACWAFHIKEAGLSVWESFRKIGIDCKTIQAFRYKSEEGFSNHQRKTWCEYEKLYSTEVRYIISKLL